jgi:hypothetical protein
MRLARFRQALDQLAGPSVPIEITEMGWATTSVPESQRATDLATLAEQLPRSDCNVTRFLPYTWLTQESNGSDPEDWFGIWNHDGSGKPSGIAYLNAVKLMRGMTGQPAPTAPVAICHPGAAAAQQAKGPKLHLKVLRVRPRHWVKVSVRCRPECILRIGLYGHIRASKARVRRLSSRTTGIHARRRVLKLRIRKAWAMRPRAQLRATAVVSTPAGIGVTHRSRRVRIR